MSRFTIIIKIILVLWGVHALGWFFSIQNYGIHPREKIGIIGIFISPFLHADVYHLIANTTSFLIFSSILILIETHLFHSILIHITIIGGFATWIFGRSANHIGASGVIFGIFSYIMAIGFFRRKFHLLLISVLVIFVYGGMISQVLPSSPGISWEGHLFGFLAGIFTAWKFSTKPNPKTTPKKIYKKKKITAKAR